MRISEAHIGVPSRAEPDFYASSKVALYIARIATPSRRMYNGRVHRADEQARRPRRLAGALPSCRGPRISRFLREDIPLGAWHLHRLGTLQSLVVSRPVMSRRARLDAGCTVTRAVAYNSDIHHHIVCFMRAKKTCLRSDHRIHHQASNQPPSLASRATPRARASHQLPARIFAPAFCVSSRSAITSACPAHR